MWSRPTILAILDSFIEAIEADARGAGSLYERVAANAFVRADGLDFSPDQLRQVLVAFRRGCRYARDTYGDDAVGCALAIASTVTRPRGSVERHDRIVYIPEDETLVITHYVMARIAARVEPHAAARVGRHGATMTWDRFPHRRFAPLDLATLQAVDGCYRHYQYATPPHQDDIDDPTAIPEIDAEAEPILLRAMDNLGIEA